MNFDDAFTDTLGCTKKKVLAHSFNYFIDIQVIDESRLVAYWLIKWNCFVVILENKGIELFCCSENSQPIRVNHPRLTVEWFVPQGLLQCLLLG